MTADQRSSSIVVDSVDQISQVGQMTSETVDIGNGKTGEKGYIRKDDGLDYAYYYNPDTGKGMVSSKPADTANNQEVQKS